MIRITKGPTPAILIQNGAQWTAELEKARAAGEDDEGFRKRYKHATIVDALVKETNGKCAYCECEPLAGLYRIVEHIVAWSKNTQLAFEWLNFVLSCERCNTAKRDYWDPASPLVDPTVDDPLRDLYFVSAMIFGKTTKGSDTVIEIKLNRPDLYESKRKWLRRIDKIASRLSAEELAKTEFLPEVVF